MKHHVEGMLILIGLAMLLTVCVVVYVIGGAMDE